MTLRKWLVTLGVWYIYVPHLAMMRLLGPRCALRVSRLLAWLHWLLTFVGAQASVRSALLKTRDHLTPGMSVSTMLRKHLELKYQHFIEWHLCATRRGRSFADRSYRNFEGDEMFERVLAEGRGCIVLGFHFGMMKLLRIGLARYDRDAYEIVFRSATWTADALPRVAKLAMLVAVNTDRKCGMKNIYIRHESKPLSVIRRLRQGRTVGMAGDGMVAGDFVEVPFLGGTMRFPTGVARLSALTGAPIVPLFGLLEGIEQHRIIAHPPIYCTENSPEAIEATVRQCAGILESYVRRYPWAWWIWHRLSFEETAECLQIKACAPQPQDREIYYEPIAE